MPATSEKQRRAAGAALAAKRRGKKAKAGTASADMMSMTASQLEDFAKKPKGKAKKRGS
jgi:hypothetical protein